MFKLVLAAFLAASSVVAHSNMFSPTPRQNRDSAYESSDQNACGFDGTDIPEENNFQRGQKVPVKWWWNNHDGGFIKMALIKDMKDFVDKNDQELFTRNMNIIQGQCYTGNCDRNGFDPGNTHECNGQDMEIPSWVSDGVYILQWSQIGGYNSEAVPTRQLPIYHTCANIRISGGVKLTPRPDDWIAPFFGGDQVQINGQSAGPNQCAFKNFDKEPADPSVVNTKDDSSDTIRFGEPDGWAAPGSSNDKRADNVYLPRLGHIARRHSCKRSAEADSDVPKLH
jgi:hypothetical protein